MENNHFEKQVQEIMAELKFQPSDKSWAGIESKIKKKDSRRRILWFLLPGLFLLGGAGYLFMLNGKFNVQQISQLPKDAESIIQKKAMDQGSSDDSIKVTIPVGLRATKPLSAGSTNKTSYSNSISSKSISHSQVIHGKKNTIPRNLKGNEKVNLIIENQDELVTEQKSTRVINASPGNKEIRKTAVLADHDSVNGNAAILSQIKENDLSDNNVFGIQSSASISETYSEKKKESVIREDSSFNKISNAGKNKLSSSSNNNWKIGFAISAARTYTGNGIHLGSEPENSFSSAAPNNSYNAPSVRPGSSFGQTSVGPASSPENSIGFMAAIILKKEISPKIIFATGLGYTYNTNTMLIGNQLPSGNYSSAGMLFSYRNNFHFLELPAIIQFRVNKGLNVPFDLSTGFTVSQLLASDAVQYKSGFYEVDNSFFNKTQLGFYAGISATFFKNISAGPFYNYGINSLAKEGLYGQKHLSFLGIKAGYTFKKNK